MRVLMLGWEFPPFISGGLGTACYGLTKGLDQIGAEVLFVLPRPIEAQGRRRFSVSARPKGSLASRVSISSSTRAFIR